jgi:non-lysosomal glucosylceramidase
MPTRKNRHLDAGHIDNSFRQGLPTGGETFSQTFRGDFGRWHLKASVHKHRKVNANEFAMFQQTEGTATGTAQVLFTDHPSRGQLSSWDGDYLLDAGDSYALYPKSWFDCRWEKFPAHIVLEQFSPILPDNYRESGFPVAVYRWHAENTATQTVTVTILCSWTNMLGWFRTFCRDFRHARGGS